MAKKSIIQKVDEGFNNEIKDALKKRIAIGKDDPLKPLSFARATRYIKNHPSWMKIKNDFIIAPRDDKRGQISDLFVFMAMAIIITLFLGLFYYAFHQTATIVDSINGTIGGSNMTIGQASQQTIGQVDSAFGSNFTILAFVMILSMILTILLSNFLVRISPAFFFLYILVTIIAVIVSVYLSNLYQGLLNDAGFGATLQTFTGANWIIINLPYVVTIVGIFGAIFLVLGILQRPDYPTGEIGVLE